jgi:ABC-2 type transport system permease protein
MPNAIRQLLKMNVKKWIEYRLDFFVGISANLLANLVSVVFFWVIYQHVTLINGWNINEMFFLLGIYYFSFGIWHFFLSGPTRVERYIINGDLDIILMRPVNPLIYMIAMKIDDDGLGDFIAGALVLGYAISSLSIAWSLFNIFMMIMALIGSVTIIFSVTLLMSSASFWFTKSSSISEIFYNLLKFIEFPLDIYNPVIKIFLTFVIPLGFINYYSAQSFLGKGGWEYASLLSPLVGLIFFSITYYVWKQGLKKYSSAGG